MLLLRRCGCGGWCGWADEDGHSGGGGGGTNVMLPTAAASSSADSLEHWLMSAAALSLFET
jgi:hypothetical protein